MRGLLVTFCNNSPSDFILGVFNFEKELFQWIDTGAVAPGTAGATGAVFADGCYWVARQGRNEGIIKLDMKLNPIAASPLRLSGDTHSILPFDSGFLVADTRNNRINFVELSEDSTTAAESEYWRYRPVDFDASHVNSLCSLNGDVYVSLFGDKPETGGWAASQDGKIINISTGEIVCDGLRHPHSLMARNGELYWLESIAGAVHKYVPGGKHEVVMKLNGYVRGLAFDDDFMYIGTSVLRRRSRSTGKVNQIDSSNIDGLCSWIYRVSMQTGEIRHCNMVPYGTEIYDLLPIPAVPAEMNAATTENAMAGRLLKLEYEMRVMGKHENELAYIKTTRWWRAREYARQLWRKCRV